MSSTTHTTVGARWQAEMEDHLKGVRERNRVLVGLTMSDPNYEKHTAVMQAHATAALALAIANAGSDIEVGLASVAEKIAETV